MFKETHPILGTRDIQREIEFYTQQLGFRLAFRDQAEPPNYVELRRDAVELHMQFQFEHEMGTIRLRFLVQDPDTLFSEYRKRGVECNSDSVQDTPLAGRRFGCINFSRGVESACHFDPKINIYRRIAVGGMMVQENVMPVGAKARAATQKLPNLIQG